MKRFLLPFHAKHEEFKWLKKFLKFCLHFAQKQIFLKKSSVFPKHSYFFGSAWGAKKIFVARSPEKKVLSHEGFISRQQRQLIGVII